MALQTCPFCNSGRTWNNCDCRYAVIAARHGLIAAKHRWADDGSPYRIRSGTLPPPAREVGLAASLAASPQTTAEPVPRARRRKPAKPAEQIIADLKGAIVGSALAPPGHCVFCDRRRAKDAQRVKRHRERQRKTAT